MQITFYKSADLFEMLLLLLIKGRSGGYTFSVCFPTLDQCNEFSTYIWNSWSALPHGLAEDGFLEKQPIVIDIKLHKKDAAIIIDDAAIIEDGWDKVLYVGKSQVLIHDAKYWLYAEQKWKEISRQEFML